ncbi:MAG TPA: hypothetical protein DIV86_06955 [Alphaproteobacteria bacterium]|nr:hypothetical protein [Alphaproteobacteria bacterium]
MEANKNIQTFEKAPVDTKTDPAKLLHLSNTFRLHKENKLKFFYPENNNKNYSEEEEELLLKARINALNCEGCSGVKDTNRNYNVRVLEEGSLKLQVIENHNIYMEEKNPFPEQEDGKIWAKTIFYAICESLSKLLKKPS